MYLGHLEGVDNPILTRLIKHVYQPLTKWDDPPSETAMKFPNRVQVQLLSAMGFEKTACFQALEVTRNKNKKREGEGTG